jgi:hypothetical protein
MTVAKKQTKIKDKSEKNLAAELNKIPTQTDSTELQTSGKQNSVQSKDDIKSANDAANNEIFDLWDANEFVPRDFKIKIPVDSLEARVGYSSLFRQMHQSFVQRVIFLQTPGGGSLSPEEARTQAFHACTNEADAKKQFQTMMRLPLESLNFVDLMELHDFAPRVAERFWERAKREGRLEFESGHLAANITFPVGYMKQVWNIARYLGVRESFIAEWQPKGGIEVALIDMLAQSYFQWQYWLEQTVKRSETRAREEHPDYQEWQRLRKKHKEETWMDGHWLPPYVKEQDAIEHAVQMADRFNRIFMRTLRQLRDLRRYSPVTINNPNQVNIASDGGQQVNVSNLSEDGTNM